MISIVLVIFALLLLPIAVYVVANSKQKEKETSVQKTTSVQFTTTVQPTTTTTTTVQPTTTTTTTTTTTFEPFTPAPSSPQPTESPSVYGNSVGELCRYNTNYVIFKILEDVDFNTCKKQCENAFSMDCYGIQHNPIEQRCGLAMVKPNSSEDWGGDDNYNCFPRTDNFQKLEYLQIENSTSYGSEVFAVRSDGYHGDLYYSSCGSSYRDDNGNCVYTSNGADVEDCKRVCSENELCTAIKYDHDRQRCFFYGLLGKYGYSNSINTTSSLHLKQKRIRNVHNEHRLVVRGTQQALSSKSGEADLRVRMLAAGVLDGVYVACTTERCPYIFSGAELRSDGFYYLPDFGEKIYIGEKGTYAMFDPEKYHGSDYHPSEVWFMPVIELNIDSARLHRYVYDEASRTSKFIIDAGSDSIECNGLDDGCHVTLLHPE